LIKIFKLLLALVSRQQGHTGNKSLQFLTGGDG